MIDALTFDREGRMYLVYDGIEAERELIGLSDTMCAVFKAAPDFDLDKLPDAARIRKSLRMPVVHVFVGIEACEPFHTPGWTAFHSNVFLRNKTKYLRENAQSLLADIV